jgi:hypothetical protein
MCIPRRGVLCNVCAREAGSYKEKPRWPHCDRGRDEGVGPIGDWLGLDWMEGIMRIHSGLFAVAVIAGAVTAAGCTVFTGPKSHPVTISVTSDTLVAFVNTGPNISWLQFTIPVAIHNGQSAPVTVDYCLASVDEPSGTDWTMVWAPVCALEGSTAPTIAPGETKTFQWPVTAAISGPGGPKWGGQTLDGTYRLSLTIGANEKLESNTFAISVLTTSAVSARDRSARGTLH